MNKRYLSLIALATLLCVMLFGTSSCKKDDTPDPNDAEFFIDVDFLLNAGTTDKVTPRLMANFNDEAVMIEFRGPTNDTPMESVLILCPEKEAMMLCGNDSLLICTAYDIETCTPSHDMLLVTPIDDNALLLTKCFMDWNTNTMTKQDMMVLPLNDNLKSHGKRGDVDSETRWFFFNGLVKPLAERFENVEDFCGIFGGYGGLVLSYIRTITTTELTIILFSDNPEEFYDAMESTVTMETALGAQLAILRRVPQQEERDLASKIYSAISWAINFGRGKVSDYFGGSTGGEEEFFMEDYFGVGRDTEQAAAQLGVFDPIFVVNMNIGNITESSAYLKGSYRLVGSSSIAPVEMGYFIKVSGGPEHKEYDMNFQGITLSGLQKATKYTAFAYVKSAFGERVFSPGVTFWTLGFEAFPSSFTFPAEGDTKSVALSYSKEDITSWDITSKPSWCTITKNGDRMFSVNVGETTETRSGIITVTGYSNALGTITENISVTQLSGNSWEWDGTSWVFTGSLTVTTIGEGETETEVVEETYTLTVNSVTNNDIVFSVNDVVVTAGSFILDENGNLVYTVSGPNQSSGRVSFTRTGPTTAIANVNLSAYIEVLLDGQHVGYIHATESGILQGTLIRADEVGNYKTTPINIITHEYFDRMLKNTD